MNAFRTINSFLRLGLVLVMIAGAGAMAQVKTAAGRVGCGQA